MISRRRMVFQLTALLDLLLVVLFAQYMETQQATRRSSRAAARRQVHEASLLISTESQRQESEKLKLAALADRAKLADQIESLADENKDLKGELASARQRLGETESGRAQDQKRAAEQLAEIGEIFRQRLNIDPKTLHAYLDTASPGERDRFLAEMQRLKDARSASVVQYLRATAEFKKVCDMWEIHINNDNSVRIRFNGKDYSAPFQIGGASEMANRLMDAARENGEPKSMVLALLTWGDADRKTRDAVVSGLHEAATVLRNGWGTPKQIEISKLGYSPEAP